MVWNFLEEWETYGKWEVTLIWGPKIWLGRCSIIEDWIAHAAITMYPQTSVASATMLISHSCYQSTACLLDTLLSHLGPRLREQPHLEHCWSLQQAQ